MAAVTAGAEPGSRPAEEAGRKADSTRVARDAPGFARAIVIVVMVGFCVVAFLNILTMGLDRFSVAACVGYMVAIMAMQIFYFTRPLVSPSRFRYLALAIQAALVYLPMFEFHQGWVGMPGFLAGSLLLSLPRRYAWPGFVLVVASMAYIQESLTHRGNDIAYTAVSTIITGGVVYGLSRLAVLLSEVAAARLQLAAMAVQAERTRFSQDLHDLLGFSLSAISLKAELAQRLVDLHPDSVGEQLDEIRDIARRAGEDVRALARGNRQLSLEQELRSVRALLTAADIEATIESELTRMDAEIEMMLATALREGITNVLRHSAARTCHVRIGCDDNLAVLDIVNDGVISVAGAGNEHTPNGLVNLEKRAATLGGSLQAGSPDQQTYRLHVNVPTRDCRRIVAEAR